MDRKTSQDLGADLVEHLGTMDCPSCHYWDADVERDEDGRVLVDCRECGYAAFVRPDSR